LEAAEEPMHAENCASEGPQLQSEQACPANGSVSDIADLDERSPLQQQTPLINAMDISEDNPALDDHQVANVSSRKALKGKDSTHTDARSCDIMDESAKQEAAEGAPCKTCWVWVSASCLKCDAHSFGPSRFYIHLKVLQCFMTKL